MALAQLPLSLPRLGALAALGLLSLAPAALAAAPPAGTATPGSAEPLSLAMVFTCFMVMLGPVKMVGPFFKMTAQMEESEARRLGLRALGIACVAGVVAAVTGQSTLTSWAIAPSSLHLAAGAILLLVALRQVLEQYKPAAEDPGAAPPAAGMAFSPLAFPTIVTPHGIATFILLLAVNHDLARELIIIGLFALVMLVNLLVLWYARPIIRRGAFLLQILGAVLGVLQVALAIQMMVDALRFLKVIAA